MIASNNIAVVVPAFRVEHQIADVIARMPAEVDHIFVVDDASPDDLSTVVNALGNPRVTLIRHEQNQGVGGATVTGMRAALESGANIVVKCDGDGQMDPAEIPRLVEPLTEGWADHAKGSRYHHVRQLGAMPRPRLAGNVVLTFLTKMASGYWHVLDPVNGFFATRTETLRGIPLQKLAKRYFFESDLLIRLNIIEARVADVAQPASYGGEPSSLSITRSAVEFPARLFAGLVRRIFLRYVFYDISPVAVFAFLGVLLSVFGVVYGGYHWIQSARTGVFTPTGTVMITTLSLIFGFELLLQALVLDIANTPRPERRQAQFLARSSTGL